jgi:predicted DNA-binding protein YlxM (UPF0122 family)
MPSKIPKELREKVLVQWIQGISLDEIANNVGIGAGTVSDIMKMYKENNSDFDLEREYVVNVKKRGYTIDQLVSAIKLELFEKLGINMEQIESLFDKTDEHRFKRGIEPEDFIKMVFDVCDLSKTKVPVEELSSDIEKKEKRIVLLKNGYNNDEDRKKKSTVWLRHHRN